MTVTKEALDALALSEAEYEAIVDRLGREPNELELGMFGSLWSEHCGYKHSKPLLRMFDADSPRLLVSAGDENAGAVDIGGGLAVVFKIESHNHPSAIEPFEGAATGVGGIVRDIFAMGARPIALLNSLRFGPPSEPRNKYLFEGVVAGISSYGNCIGIPNVGGEVVFSPSYSGNPLVNAMCVGLVEKDKLMRATTGPPGSVMMLVGSETGRDGIHGASGLASRTFEDDREMRPAVQVSNPFLEKVLIEACLEAAASGHVVGLQDLGAAGLTSASVEAAGNGGCGFDLEVSDVPRRESGMTPYEVMLSESQERMLLFVREDSVDQVCSIFERWDIDATVIGRATEGRNARIYERGVPRGEAPVRTLRDAPQYRLDGAEPAWQAELQAYDLDSVPLPRESPSLVLLRLLASPNIASKEPVYRQYDHHVQTNTVADPGADAAVLRIKGAGKGLALATDGNGRYCYLDPYVGGMIAVAEACRNVSAMGAEPIALTNCLNFGNPERADVYYQLEKCVEGMAMASRALGAPVVSGNVSLYNETRGEAIYPTPIVGALGLFEDVTTHVTPGFEDEGDAIVLIGAGKLAGAADSLAGSEYLELVHGLVAGCPALDIDLEAAAQRACREATDRRLLRSTHDCSDGGIAAAIAESCIVGGVGARIDAAITGRWDAALFGEAQSRIVVSLAPEMLGDFGDVCKEADAPWVVIGAVGGDSMAVSGLLDVRVEDLAAAWNGGLDNAKNTAPQAGQGETRSP